MKLISLILFSMALTPSFANDCYKDLCTGDVVRDIYGWKGSVDSFDIEKENVLVSLHHIPSVFPFPYNELGKQVFCFEEFCEGQRLVDQYGYEIIVEEVYNHQMLYAYNLGVDGRMLYDFKELR